MPKVQELEFIVRKLIGQPDPLNSRFRGNMLDFFNLAMETVAFDTESLTNEYDDTSKVGEDEIVLPENTVGVHWARYDGRKLTKKDGTWLDEHYPGWPNMSSGIPKIYYHRRTASKLRSIGLFPKPDTENKIIRMSISTIPFYLTSVEQEPPIPKVFHRYLIPIVCSYCENDMGNKDRAQTFLNQYDKDILKLQKIAAEPDDDGPLSFTPGDPEPRVTGNNPRFWI